MQVEIHNNAEDIRIRCLAVTVEKLQKTMDDKNQAQELTMDEIKVALQ